jgi:hypothetical protein
MKASTITSTNVYLTKQDDTTKIPAKVSYASKVATLDPSTDLDPNASYTATVLGGKSGVRAKDGSLLGGTKDTTATFSNSNVTWSFTTAPVVDCPTGDCDPPQVDSTSPRDDATDVPVDTNITITYSEKIDPASVDNSTVSVS